MEEQHIQTPAFPQSPTGKEGVHDSLGIVVSVCYSFELRRPLKSLSLLC